MALNWVRLVEYEQGHWGDIGKAKAISDDVLTLQNNNLGYLFRLAPRGYVLVPTRRELAPVSAYSETTHMLTRTPGGFFDLLNESLRDRVKGLQDLDIRGDKALPEHPAWALLTLPAAEFERWLAGKDDEWEGVGPMLTSAWHQGWPFNLYCPSGSGALSTYVGCTGLAMAQLMCYHQWPMRGEGSVSYWWDGDADCGSGSSGATINANFMVPHEWTMMPDTMDWLTPGDQQQATAELCYHVSAAIWTDFSTCGSSASLSRASAALVNNFSYQYGCREYPRFRYTDASWFGLIRNEIDAGYPTLYASTIHSMVCDGWRESVDIQQIHLNYGWGGDSDNWYTLDNIETSLNPYAERMVAGIRPGGIVETLVPELIVERNAGDGCLAWGLETLNTSAGFYVWRGLSEADRICLTTLPFTGATSYEWTDIGAPITGINYWLEMIIAGVPSIWIGPEWLDPKPPRGDEVVIPTADPNPFNPITSIAFDLPRDAMVQAEIFDLAGRRVKTLANAVLTAGPQRFMWDGRDEAGRHAPSGRYLLRLAVDGNAATTKLTLTR